MGVAGAAWATILSQFFSAVLSLVVGLKNFPILHLHREDFTDLKDTAILRLKNKARAVHPPYSDFRNKAESVRY